MCQRVLVPSSDRVPSWVWSHQSRHTGTCCLFHCSSHHTLLVQATLATFLPRYHLSLVLELFWGTSSLLTIHSWPPIALIISSPLSPAHLSGLIQSLFFFYLGSLPFPRVPNNHLFWNMLKVAFSPKNISPSLWYDSSYKHIELYSGAFPLNLS